MLQRSSERTEYATERMIIVALFLASLCIRLSAIWYWQFDGLYGQDAFAYLRQAIGIADNLPRGLPPPTDFYWPNGYPLLAALVMSVFGKTALAAQVAGLLCGSLLAPLLYMLSRALLPEYGHGPGVLAGAIVATAGQPVLSSIVVMADMPALAWATLAALFAIYAARTQHQSRWAIGVGVALGMAVISRWIYWLSIPALGLYLLLAGKQSHHFAVSSLLSVSSVAKNLRPVLFAALGGALVLLPQLWLTARGPQGLDHPWLLGWSPANFFRREFTNPDGHFAYQLPVALFYAQTAFHPAYIFPLLAPAIPWGAWRLWRSGERAALLLLLGWSVPVYLFLAGIPYQNFRFGLAFYAPLAILAGVGVSSLWTRTRNAERRALDYGSRITYHASRILTTLSLAAMLAWSYRTLDGFLTAQNESKRIAQTVEQALPAQASVVSFGLTLTLQHYTRLDVHEIYYLDTPALETLVSAKSPLFLLIDPGIEAQWRGRSPFENYVWLQQHTRLERVRSFPPYELFEIRR